MATTEIMQLHSAGEEPKPRFDYRGRHRYVVTLETLDARPVFAGREEVRAVLGALRDESLTHHFEVLIYTFQPSTLTLLVRGKEEGANMKTFLAAFRAAAAAATTATAGPRLWKRTYLERVLRKTEELRNVIREVAMIPVRAGLAPHPLAYEFQGSFVDELSSLLPRPGGSTSSRPQRSFGKGRNDHPKGSNQPGRPYRSNHAGRRNGPPRRDGRADIHKKKPNR
jgi:hypothetical protein